MGISISKIISLYHVKNRNKCIKIQKKCIHRILSQFKLFAKGNMIWYYKKKNNGGNINAEIQMQSLRI